MVGKLFKKWILSIVPVQFALYGLQCLFASSTFSNYHIAKSTCNDTLIAFFAGNCSSHNNEELLNYLELWFAYLKDDIWKFQAAIAMTYVFHLLRDISLIRVGIFLTLTTLFSLVVDLFSINFSSSSMHITWLIVTVLLSIIVTNIYYKKEETKE